jgi:uncharacterized UPF0160 family protein
MQQILTKQLQKLTLHYDALAEYKNFIDILNFDFSINSFNKLKVEQKAVLEAYLKRFAQVQDFLGAKVFASILNEKGIVWNKMSEVLTLIEKEQIINLDRWIEFRNLRNHLEHDYPDNLQLALYDLQKCIHAFDEIVDIVEKVNNFAIKT